MALSGKAPHSLKLLQRNTVTDRHKLTRRKRIIWAPGFRDIQSITLGTTLWGSWLELNYGLSRNLRSLNAFFHSLVPTSERLRRHLQCGTTAGKQVLKTGARGEHSRFKSQQALIFTYCFFVFCGLSKPGFLEERRYEGEENRLFGPLNLQLALYLWLWGTALLGGGFTVCLVT